MIELPSVAQVTAVEAVFVRVCVIEFFVVGLIDCQGLKTVCGSIRIPARECS